MTAEELPFGNLFFVVLAVAVCAVCILIAFVAFKMDQGDLSKISEVVYFQETIDPTHPIYVISIRIRELMTYNGVTDLIFRLRGTTKDSPVILYRNHNCDRIRSGQVLNLGVALPYELGSLVEVDLACDNSKAEESEPIMVISDVFVRQLPRNDTALKGWSKMNESTILGASATDLFEGLTNKVRTWAGLETLCVTGGVGVVGISVTETGREQTLRARDVAISLSMEEESDFLKRRNVTGFRPQHYFFSVTRGWHDIWSDFSRFDVVAVVCLDLVAILVIVSLSFVYKLERFIGATSLSATITNSNKSPFETFDLYSLKQENMSTWLSKNIGSLIEAICVAFVSGLVVVPLSLLWSKLFKLVGGKGFQRALKLAQNPVSEDYEAPKNAMLRASAGFVRSLASSSASRLDNMTPSAHLLLRTLECKNVLTAIPSGKSCIKHPNVLHESHTQSTDSPEMPMPTKLPGEKGEIVRVARYCERLVQQASKQIKDNSVIAECFEIDSKKSKRDGDRIDPKKCCPRRCCGCPPPADGPVEKLKQANESFSNATFFNEEDALSVHELMTQFPNVLHQGEKINEELILEEFADNQMAMMEEEEGSEMEDESSNQEEIYSEDEDENDSDSWIPSPSAKLRKQRQQRRNSKFSKELHEKVAEHYSRRTKRLVDSGTVEKYPRSLSPRSTNNLFKDESDKSSIMRNKRRRTAKNKTSTNSVRFDFIRNISSSDTKSSYAPPKFKKGKKRTKQRAARKKSKKGKKTPFPSGAPDLTAYSDDFVSAKSHISSNTRPLPPVPKKLPFKGNKVKISVFAFLCCLQLAELYFLTAFETDINSLFGKREGMNRRHGAVMCAFIGLVSYFACFVHLIALASYLVEYMRNRNNYSEYSEQYSAA